MSKVLELLTSRRFWLLGIAAVAWGLLQAQLLPPEIATPLIGWALAAAGVGTLDKIIK